MHLVFLFCLMPPPMYGIQLQLCNLRDLALIRPPVIIVIIILYIPGFISYFSHVITYTFTISVSYYKTNILFVVCDVCVVGSTFVSRKPGDDPTRYDYLLWNPYHACIWTKLYVVRKHPNCGLPRLRRRTSVAPYIAHAWPTCLFFFSWGEEAP